MNVAKVLDELASGAPDRPAIGVAGRAPLTFGSLAAQLRYVRECLTGWGLGPGDIVAAMMPQRPAMAALLLTFPGTATLARLSPRTDAVLATELLARLGARAIVLPASSLFESLTPRGLAERFRAAMPPKERFTLTCVSPGRNLPPVVAVPAGFELIAFHRLARALGPDQPFHGFQLTGAGGIDELGSVEEVAAELVACMRGTLGHRPVCIIGLCFGAVVAYEMARLVTESGGEVLFLGLLDPSQIRRSPESPPAVRNRVRLRRMRSVGRFLIGRAREYGAAMRDMDVGVRLRYLAEKTLNAAGLFDPTRFAGVRQQVAAINDFTFRRDLLQGYAPKPINRGLATLEVFETSSRFAGTLSGRRLDWRQFAPQQSAHHAVPGHDSGTMVNETNGNTLGRLLAERLRLNS